MDIGCIGKKIMTAAIALALAFSVAPLGTMNAGAASSANDPVKVTVNKYGYEVIDGKRIITAENLEGAKLQILDKSGNKVYPKNNDSFTTTGSPAVVELSPGEYYLKEIEAPEGYEKESEPVAFTAANSKIGEFSETKTYKGINEGEGGLVFGASNLALYTEKEQYVASCIQPGVPAPTTVTGNVSYKYVEETKYSALSALQIAKIKKIISLYESKDPTLIAKLKNSQGPKQLEAGLYIAAEVAIWKIVDPENKYTCRFNVYNQQWTGNLPAAVDYLKTEANKIKSVEDLDDELKSKVLAIFQTEENCQNIVVLELFDGSSRVAIGNKKESSSSGSVDVTVRKYGYELAEGKEKIVVESLAGAKLQIKDKNGNKVYPQGAAEYFVSKDTPSVIKLDPGEYKLIEIEAPEGYEKTDKEVPFTVSEPKVEGIDPSAAYNGVLDSLADGVYLCYNFAVYHNGRSIGEAACVQPGLSNPSGKPGTSGYVYTSEAEYSDLTPLQKARIKKLVDMYCKEDAGAIAALKTGSQMNPNYKKSSLYYAVRAAIGEVVKPGYLGTAGLKKTNSDGNLPAAANYFVTEANKICSENDLDNDLKAKQLAFFATDANKQNLVLLQLFKGSSGSVEVSIGNKKASLTNYVVKYLDMEEESVHPDKVVNDVEIGSEITEIAEDVEGYIALRPTTITKTMKKDNNVFIFYYRLKGDDY